MTGSEGPEVLFIGHGAERSGPPIFLANLQGWLATHTDLRFATLLARGGPFVAEYRRHGPVTVLERPWAPARLVDRLGPVRSAWDRLGLQGHQAPLVYVNTMAPSTLRLLAAVPVEATVVAHVHEMEAALAYGLDDGGRALLRDRPDRYIAASQAVADNLTANHTVDPERITVHHEFIEPVAALDARERGAARRAVGVAEDAFVVVGSGMLEWRKAPELFVRLAADPQARTERPIAFVWVGADHGPLWAPLDHEARHLGVAEVVHLVGTQSDPGAWFRVADAFALVSREDAFPLAALESGSAGVPLVTFDTGGMVELVGDGVGGAVVAYPDTVAMAEVLARWAGDDEERRRQGTILAERVRTRHVTEVAAPALWADLERWLDR